MADTARDLVHLHELLAPSLGEEATNELMEFLPPVRYADLATKDDLRALDQSLRAELRSEIGAVRQEIGELRGEFGELRGQFGELRGGQESVVSRLDALRFELLSQVDQRLRMQTWVTVGTLLTGIGVATAVGAGMG